MLDFTRVKPGERDAADAALAADGGAAATAAAARTFDPGEGLPAPARPTAAPTADRLAAVRAAIAGAATLEEVARLEAALAGGEGDDGMDEG